MLPAFASFRQAQARSGADIKRIDTRKCRVSLLTGEYDYSCTAAMTGAVAASIPGCRMTIMKGMGHFPMV